MPNLDQAIDKVHSQFQTVALSVILRLYQMKAADASLFRLMTAHAAFTLAQSEGQLCGQSGCEVVFAHHRKIAPQNLRTLDDIYSQNTVITAFSVFDTFLSDLTRFLLLMHPNAIPKERSIKVGEILNHTDFSGVLDGITEKYVYELSYRNITERIQYLTQAFGIKLVNVAEQITKLQDFSDLRNRIVHDVSAFRYQASNNPGELRVIERENALQIRWEVAEQIVDTCITVSNEIFTETSKHIFGLEPNIKFPIP